MGRWGNVDNPLVKAVAGFAVPLFLALNFPAVFSALVAGVMIYAAALLTVVYTYRRSHRVVGRPEVLARLAASALAAVKDGCERTIARGLEEHKRRSNLKRERRERLKHYRRERNRRKREQVRKALTPVSGTGDSSQTR